MTQNLSLANIFVIVIVFLLLSFFILAFIITLYISFVYHLPAACHYYEPDKKPIPKFMSERDQSINQSTLSDEEVEDSTLHSDDINTKARNNDIDSKKDNNLASTENNDLKVEGNVTPIHSSSTESTPPESKSYTLVSSGIYVSLDIQPYSRNLFLEGSLSAPVWCNGIWHKGNAIYFPSEETIHDSQMFYFFYEDILSVTLIPDGVQMFISVQANPNNHSESHDPILSSLTNQPTSEKSPQDLHDAVIRVTVRREFPDQDPLEPTRTDFYQHLIKHCPHLSRRKNKYFVILQGEEAKLMWGSGLRYVFEANGVVHVENTNSEVATQKCIMKLEEYISKQSSSFIDECPIETNTLDGIICIGKDGNMESACISGLKALKEELSSPVGIIQLNGVNQDDLGQLISKWLKITRKPAVYRASILKVTIHTEDSVKVVNTSQPFFFGWIPYIKYKEDCYCVRTKRNFLIASINNILNGILRPCVYILSLIQFTSSTTSELTFALPVQNKLKSFNYSGFHTYIEPKESFLQLIRSTVTISNQSYVSSLFQLISNIRTAWKVEAQLMKDGENSFNLFEEPIQSETFVIKSKSPFITSNNRKLIKDVIQMDVETDTFHPLLFRN